MHPTQDVFATVAEDSTLAVWELPADGERGRAGGAPAGSMRLRRVLAGRDAHGGGVLRGEVEKPRGWNVRTRRDAHLRVAIESESERDE